MRILMINNLLYPNKGSEMYIVEMLQNSGDKLNSKVTKGQNQPFSLHTLHSATADDFIIRIFSFATGIRVKHSSL